MLLQVGDGSAGEKFRVPTDMLAPTTNPHDLVRSVFCDLRTDPAARSEASLMRRAILTPKNTDVNDINDYASTLMPGQERVYTSADAVGMDDDATVWQVEFLNTLQPAGFPPHQLRLKVGMPVMLLRNISPSEGLANGTRLILTHMGAHYVKGKIMTGSDAHVNTTAIIPRCKLTCMEHEGLPVEVVRRQLPLKPGFAMTINKSQGQTFDQVGVFLPKPCFTHGQLYVAMSRVGRPGGLTLMVGHGRTDGDALPTGRGVYTDNVVYTEVFDRLAAPPAAVAQPLG